MKSDSSYRELIQAVVVKKPKERLKFDKLVCSTILKALSIHLYDYDNVAIMWYINY